MAQVDFPYTTFSDPLGRPLSNGMAVITLNTDVQSPNGQLCAGLEVSVPLDSDGEMTSVPQVWQNASLSPTGSVYILRAYSSAGELVFGPMQITV